MDNCPAGPIKHHAFFAKVDFDKLERRQIEPPFKPKIVRICLDIFVELNFPWKINQRNVRVP